MKDAQEGEPQKSYESHPVVEEYDDEQAGRLSTEHSLPDKLARSLCSRLIASQRLYYIYGLLFNAFLLCLYVVMVFSEHRACKSKSGKVDVTRNMEILFQVGFLAAVCSFVDAAFFELYMRQKSFREMSLNGYISRRTEKLVLRYILCQYVFRVATIGLSLA